MDEHRRDSWMRRRLMRLTAWEKRAVNSPQHAERTVRTGLELIEHVELPDRPECLELGCGQGALARLLTERFHARVTATDFDPAQVALAESRLSDLRGRVILRVADARDLPFEDARFDAVFSFGAIHHIAGGWRRVIAQVAHVLKPEGAFVFTDIYLADWVARWIRQLRPLFDQLEHGPLADALAENGFRIDHECWERHACGLLASGRTVARRRSPPPESVGE